MILLFPGFIMRKVSCAFYAHNTFTTFNKKWESSLRISIGFNLRLKENLLCLECFQRLPERSPIVTIMIYALYGKGG